MLSQFFPKVLAFNVGNSREILGMVIQVPKAGHQVRIEQQCPPLIVLLTFLDGFEVCNFEKVLFQNFPHRTNLCNDQSEVSIVTIDQSQVTCSLFTDNLGMRAVVLKSSGCHSVMPLTSRGGSIGDIILCLSLTINVFLVLINRDLLRIPMVIT